MRRTDLGESALRDARRRYAPYLQCVMLVQTSLHEGGVNNQRAVARSSGCVLVLQPYLVEVKSSLVVGCFGAVLVSASPS